MAEIIEQHRAELEDLCRRYHVRTLELFGSAAVGRFDPQRSDLDFLVEFLPDAASQAFSCYFEFLESLRRLFRRKVDLVMPSAIRNPYLLKAINQQRQVLYAA